jgi:dolichol-phosphate mannosyltransferase
MALAAMNSWQRPSKPPAREYLLVVRAINSIMKRTLVTGASGFVGANLTRRLLADGHEVHLLLRPGFQSWRVSGIREQVRIHEIDLLDADALERVVASVRPEWVFHLAAHGAYSWQDDFPQILATNLHATIHLVQACLKTGVEAFIHAGSSSEYGLKDHAPAESEGLEPNSHYAVAKAAAALYCQFVARRDGAPISTLRLYSAYGPYEDPQRLVPMLVRRGLAGEFPPLVAPETARDYVYVDDIVEAFILAAIRARNHPGAIYNIGSGMQTQLGEVVEVVRRVLRIASEPEWSSMPQRRWDTSVWVADPQHAADQLGWKAAVSFEEGFRRTVAWFRSEPWITPHYAANSAPPR